MPNSLIFGRRKGYVNPDPRRKHAGKSTLGLDKSGGGSGGQGRGRARSDSVSSADSDAASVDRNGGGGDGDDGSAASDSDDEVSMRTHTCPVIFVHTFLSIFRRGVTLTMKAASPCNLWPYTTHRKPTTA